MESRGRSRSQAGWVKKGEGREDMALLAMMEWVVVVMGWLGRKAGAFAWFNQGSSGVGLARLRAF